MLKHHVSSDHCGPKQTNLCVVQVREKCRYGKRELLRRKLWAHLVG